MVRHVRRPPDPTDPSALLPLPQRAPAAPRRRPSPTPPPSAGAERLRSEQQLIEARAGNVYEPQLGLTRSRRRPATLGDVLTPAARRLDHLIMRSRPLIDEPIAERYRAVVDDLRYLK